MVGTSRSKNELDCFPYFRRLIKCRRQQQNGYPNCYHYDYRSYDLKLGRAWPNYCNNVSSWSWCPRAPSFHRPSSQGPIWVLCFYCLGSPSKKGLPHVNCLRTIENSGYIGSLFNLLSLGWAAPSLQESSCTSLNFMRPINPTVFVSK